MIQWLETMTYPLPKKTSPFEHFFLVCPLIIERHHGKSMENQLFFKQI